MGLSGLVGFVGGNEGFNWELASIFGTALGTSALALATGWLAYTTSSDVRATWRLAELTYADQQAAEQPIVIVNSMSWAASREPREGRVAVGIRNVGRGPATRVVVNVGPSEQVLVGVIMVEAQKPIASLTAGELVDLTFAVRFDREYRNVSPITDFVVRGWYSDRTGATQERLTNPLASPMEMGLRVDSGLTDRAARGDLERP